MHRKRLVTPGLSPQGGSSHRAAPGTLGSISGAPGPLLMTTSSPRAMGSSGSSQRQIVCLSQGPRTKWAIHRTGSNHVTHIEENPVGWVPPLTRTWFRGLRQTGLNGPGSPWVCWSFGDAWGFPWSFCPRRKRQAAGPWSLESWTVRGLGPKAQAPWLGNVLRCWVSGGRAGDSIL